MSLVCLDCHAQNDNELGELNHKPGCSYAVTTQVDPNRADKHTKRGSKPTNTKSITAVVRLAERLTYDFGDVFWEPVGEIVETGFDSYGLEAWPRRHEVKRIELDCRTWVKTAHYFGDLGEIDTSLWPQDEDQARQMALTFGQEKVLKEIQEARHKSDKALREMNRLQAITEVSTAASSDREASDA